MIPIGIPFLFCYLVCFFHFFFFIFLFLFCFFFFLFLFLFVSFSFCLFFFRFLFLFFSFCFFSLGFSWGTVISAKLVGRIFSRNSLYNISGRNGKSRKSLRSLKTLFVWDSGGSFETVVGHFLGSGARRRGETLSDSLGISGTNGPGDSCNVRGGRGPISESSKAGVSQAQSWVFRAKLFRATLKTLTSLNKEVRAFFLSDNSIWSLPSVSSLSDYSIWRSWRLFYPCDHSTWSIWVDCPQMLLSLRKNGQEESGLLNLRRLRSSRESPPPRPGAWSRCHLSNWLFSPETVHFGGPRRLCWPASDIYHVEGILVSKYSIWEHFGLCLLKTCVSPGRKKVWQGHSLYSFWVSQMLENGRSGGPKHAPFPG